MDSPSTSTNGLAITPPLALAFLAFWLKKQEDARADQRKRDDEKRAQERKDDEDSRAQRRREEEEARAKRRREEEEARSEQRRLEEEARIEQRKAAAEKAAQTQQTWNLMLLKSHQNAERYYMPLASAADRIARSKKEADEASDEARRQEKIEICFFSYLLFLSRMKQMSRMIGGFYFKDRQGEIIAVRLWTAILEWTDDTFTRLLREQCTALVHPRSSFADFGSVAHDPLINNMRARFSAAFASLSPVATLFQAFSVVVEYEMNRPYEHWYPKPEQFKREVAVGLIEALRGYQSKEWTALADDFDAYVLYVDGVHPASD